MISCRFASAASALCLSVLVLASADRPAGAAIAQGMTIVEWHPDSPTKCPSPGESQDYSMEALLPPGEHIHLMVTVACFSCPVEVRFADCLTGLGAGSFRIGNPGVPAAYALDCPNDKVLTNSNAVGAVVVKAVGSLAPGVAVPPIPLDCASVWANVAGTWTLQGTITVVACLDRDGAGGVNAADLSIWLSDFFTAAYNPLDDYDYSKTLGPADLSMWLTYYFNACNTVTATPPCP